MSIGSKIYKRFGLKFALAYRIRKTKRKILRKTFVQKPLMFYFLFNLQRDFKAFRIYCTLRQQNILIINPKNLNFILQHYKLILQWLNSQEFKEQYINTNHPYPPLLNPKRLNAKRESQRIEKDSKNQKNVLDKESKSYNEIKNGLDSKDIQPYPNLSYESISPELAWDLNLPLPRNYCGILACFGLSGHLALLAFLYRCGASIISLSNTRDAKKDYYAAYQTLLTNHINFLAHINYMQDKENRKHILALADAKVPVLINLRDPIGRLKHGINHGWYKNNQWIYEINQYKESLDRVTYNGQDKPYLDLLESVFENKNIGNISIWEYHQTIQEIGNASSIHYLDMQEIVGKRTFDTMTQLSQKFGFPPPKEEDRKFYESKINNQYRYLLPITFIEKDIKIDVNQLISSPKNKINLIEKLSLDSLGLEVGLFVNEVDFEKIMQNLALKQKITTKMQEYLQLLKDKTYSVEANKVTESQVLEYLKEHQEIRKIYQTYFEKEFMHIKANRPDIVESWKYYQEFERMCEELDLSL